MSLRFNPPYDPELRCSSRSWMPSLTGAAMRSRRLSLCVTFARRSALASTRACGASAGRPLSSASSTWSVVGWITSGVFLAAVRSPSIAVPAHAARLHSGYEALASLFGVYQYYVGKLAVLLGISNASTSLQFVQTLHYVCDPCMAGSTCRTTTMCHSGNRSSRNWW